MHFQPNDAAALKISAEGRAILRDIVKRHPDWIDYREANDLDMSQIATKEAWVKVCNDLQISIPDALSGKDPLSADSAPKADKPKAEAEAKPKTPRPVAPVAPAHAPNDAAANLAAALAQFAAANAAPVDMAQVQAAIDAKAVDMLAGVNLALEATSRAIHTSMEAAKADVQAAIDEAIKSAAVVRIELKRGDEIRVMEGRQHPKAPQLMRALSARQADGYAPSVWLAGPAGSGKTHAAKSAAKALGVAFHYNGALSMPHELLGFIDAAGTYHRTAFREAYEHGGVYLFDEVDGSDNSALLAMNAALANGHATFPDGQITRHPDCFIVATANTWGLGATADYVGRSKIDAAFLSRFPVRIAWDYDEDLEQAISGNPAFAKRVQKARAAARKAGLKVLIDPRATMAGAALIAAGMTEREAAELTYLANLSADQQRIIEG